MAQILNAEYQETQTYKSAGMNESQFYVDSGTVSTDDETVYRMLAREASNYIKTVAKTPFYDFRTKNQSFIELWHDLKKLGIKNNKFFLRLYDRDLQGVDPYSRVLPKETQLKILFECMINPWYWLREILRIPEDGKPLEVGGGTQYRIDRNNLACWYLFLNGIDHYQSKPRQTGKTQDCIARFNYAYHFGNMASSMLLFNKDQEQANINLYRLKCQRDMMPTYLQMRFIVTDDGKLDKGVDNTKSIRNPVTGNIIMTMGKATNKESAMKLGRGATACLQNYDEFDFMPWQTEVIGAASYAYSTAARNAKENGALYGRILSSTPGDLDSRDGAAATEYITHMLVWNDHMLDEPIEKIRSIACDRVHNRFVYVEHTWKQLKKSNAWYEEQCGLVSFDMEKILREIELQRIHGSSQSPFKRSDIMYLTNHKQTAIDERDYSKNYCPIKIYTKLRRNKVYIMGVDPSEGLALDNNAMTLIDPVTQSPVAEFQSPYISQPDFCRLIVQFMEEYCPRTMIVVENNKGRELINCLLETKFRFNVYYDDGKLLDKVIDKTDIRGRLIQEAMQRRAYGLSTTRTNRPQYFAILENLVEERKNILTTPNLVTDICGLIRKPNGKIEAGKDCHDDSVMSYLIGLFVYYNADYDKLAEYGVLRGAADEFDNEYTEDGNLSEEGVMKKLVSMLPQLPENMRQLIMSSAMEKDPVKEAMHYYKEIDQARQAINQDREAFDMGMRPGEPILPYPEGKDSAQWGQIDENLWNGNYRNSGFDPSDPFSDPTQPFDVEDYL